MEVEKNRGGIMGVKRLVEIAYSTKKFVIARTPPWGYKRPVVLRGYPVTALNPTDPQFAQRLKLALAAQKVRGTTGKAMYKGVLMPAVCSKIAGMITGSTGGKTKEERAAARHAAADAHIESMKAEAKRRGISVKV